MSSLPHSPLALALPCPMSPEPVSGTLMNGSDLPEPSLVPQSTALDLHIALIISTSGIRHMLVLTMTMCRIAQQDLGDTQSEKLSLLRTPSGEN